MMVLLRGLARPCGWLSCDGRACAAAAVHERIVSWDGLDGEKTWTVPNRAGNGPRDRRQAGIGLSLPDIALGLDRDGEAPALIVADQHGSDFEITLRPAGAIASDKVVEEFERGTVKGAESLFLNPCGDHPPQQVRGQVLRRRAPERRLPAPPQRIAR